MNKPQQARKPRYRVVPQKKIQALAVQTDVNQTQEKEPKSQKQTKWFPFFKDSNNIYINDLAARTKRSSTHGAIVQSKANYTKGQDFLYYKESEEVNYEDLEVNFKEYLNEVNNKRQSLHDVFGLNSYDFVYSGNAYLEVIRSKNFTSIFYLDASKVRVSEDTAYISAYWRDIENDPTKGSSDYPISTLELWNGEIDTKQKHFVVHVKNTTPEYDYYGLPEHIHVLKWADVEYKIAQFNLSKLKNGFFPSASITMVGQPPEGYTAKTYVEAIKDSFTDESNNHKMIVQLVNDAEQAPIINEFTTTREGEMLELQRLARENIISGHRWFASLAGIATAGQLGSNQQIRNEYNIALKSVVVPQFQNPLLNVYNDIIKMLGFDIELGVLNVAPVGIEDKIDPMQILDKNELRELLGYEPIEQSDEPNNGNDDVNGSEDVSNSGQ